MKPNGSMLGGAMRKMNFEPYARYFLKFLEGYKAEGVSIDAASPWQNESGRRGRKGAWPACLWAQEQEIDFVQNHLGPRCAKPGPRPKKKKKKSWGVPGRGGGGGGGGTPPI